VLESIYQIFIENMILRFRLESERSRSVTEVVRNSCNIYFDYHLSLGPIIRLMMEEARRADSVLAPHRDTAHKAVAGVMKAGMQRVTGRELDGLVFLTLIWTLESYSLYLLNRTDCSAETIAYYKGVMTGIAGAILSDQTDWSKPSSVL
jgi:hypothetical protein